MKILVVDDEEHLRRMMRMTLEASGYEVTEAADGEEGLRAFGDGARFDATLLDQKLPGIDGLETLRRMKAIEADACIIMVTAYATIELAVDAMKLGATDFVRKPMTPETLRYAVAAAVAKRVPVAAPAGVGEPATDAVVPRSPAEIWTTNGFYIRRVPHKAEDADRLSAAHHFIVRRGSEQTGSEVVVTIDPWALARLAREARRDLNPAGAFWRHQAENALVNYLWSEAQLPLDGRLVVETFPGSAIDEAMDWAQD